MEDPFNMYAAKPSSISKRPTYGNPPTVPYDATRYNKIDNNNNDAYIIYIIIIKDVGFLKIRHFNIL